MVEMTLSEIF